MATQLNANCWTISNYAKPDTSVAAEAAAIIGRIEASPVGFCNVSVLVFENQAAATAALQSSFAIGQGAPSPIASFRWRITGASYIALQEAFASGGASAMTAIGSVITTTPPTGLTGPGSAPKASPLAGATPGTLAYSCPGT